VVGLSAAPGFVAGLRETGPSLLVVGLVVAVTPHIAALLFGRYVLKMNPVILLGACSGAGTVTAALRAIQDEAESKLPILGYSVPYAIGNILLTAWGPVIVMLTRQEMDRVHALRWLRGYERAWLRGDVVASGTARMRSSSSLTPGMSGVRATKVLSGKVS
jgi:hypothetical protein